MTDLPDPVLRTRHSPPPPPVWRLKPGTATIPWECTPEGIRSRCHGRCCTVGWWPPKPDGRCVHLDPDTGCTLGVGRPVACHLYPLQVKANGTMVAHAMTRYPGAMCMGNRGAAGAPMLIDALRPGLVALFGAEEWVAARAAVVGGRDYLFVVPKWVLDAIEQEAVWEVAGVPPERRV